MLAKYLILHALFAVAVSSFEVEGSSSAKATADKSEEKLARSSTASLEERLRQIDAELGKIALQSLNTGVGPIGYRSEIHSEPNHREWVEIDLGEESLLEEVVLVPALTRDPQLGFVSDAFPAAFRILAGTGDDRVGSVVAEIDDTSALLPRIAPLVVSL